MKVVVAVVALLLSACTGQRPDHQVSTVAQQPEQHSSFGGVPPRAVPAWPVPSDAVEHPYGFSMILRNGEGAIRAETNLNQGVVMFVRYFDRENRVTGSGSWFTSMHELSPQMQQVVADMTVGEVRRVWFAAATPERAVVDVHLLRVDPPSSRPAG